MLLLLLCQRNALEYYAASLMHWVIPLEKIHRNRPDEKHIEDKIHHGGSSKNYDNGWHGRGDQKLSM
jgi:hypothetical protein